MRARPDRVLCILRQSGVSVLLLAHGFRQSDYAAMLAEVRSRLPDLRVALVIDDSFEELLRADHVHRRTPSLALCRVRPLLAADGNHGWVAVSGRGYEGRGGADAYARGDYLLRHGSAFRKSGESSPVRQVGMVYVSNRPRQRTRCISSIASACRRGSAASSSAHSRSLAQRKCRELASLHPLSLLPPAASPY